jgi:hypothetical protein
MDYIIHCTLLYSSSSSLTDSVAHSIAMSSKRKWDQAAPEESNDDPESPAKVAKVDESKNLAAAAVAAIAAKITAQYSGAGGGGGLLGPKDIHDGEFTQDIDINDVRNRYMLTKGSTQQQVRDSSYPRRTYLANACVHFSFRYTTKQELPLAQKAYGTPIAQRLRRKTPRCTYTYLRTRKKCCSWPWTESMSSSQLTWGLSLRIKEGEKRCVLFCVIAGCFRSRLLSVNGLRRKSLSAWSQSVILTCAPRLLALL